MGLNLEEPEAPKRVIINIHGPAGSGKTFTGCGVAIACAIVNGTKEVWQFDCEDASGWLAERCKENGVKLVRHNAKDPKDRTVAILKEFFDAAPPNVPIVVDQMTSVMNADQADMMKAKPWIAKMAQNKDTAGMGIGKSRKRFNDFCSKVTDYDRPMIFLARHGMEYGHQRDSDGKDSSVPIGHKAKAGELQYECDASLYAFEEGVKEGKKGPVSRVHSFKVGKDRTGIIGKELGETVEFKANPANPTEAMREVLKVFGPVVRGMLSESGEANDK